MKATESTLLAAGPSPPSIGFLLAIHSYALAYSLVMATLGIVVLPSEAVRLFPHSHAMMLALMLGCTGICQLISPLVGYVSDRTTSRWGRRRPFLVAGACIALLGLGGMLAGHRWRSGATFVASLATTTFGLNCAYSGYTALLPDLVPGSNCNIAL